MSDEVEPATVHAVAAIIQQYYQPWESITADDLEVSIISGGLCNRNFRVGLKESVMDKCSGPHAVMCRLFGEGTDDLVNRDNEQVFELYSWLLVIHICVDSGLHLKTKILL